MADPLTPGAQGRSSVASALPPNATSATPWRRIKPRYTQNEIFFDFVETVNCCVNGCVRHLVLRPAAS